MPDWLTDLSLKIFPGLVIAVFSAWISVRLSLNKFRNERRWEKKFEVYGKIIEAFYVSKEYYNKYIDSEEAGRTLDGIEGGALLDRARKSHDDLIKFSSVQQLILSKESQEVLNKYKNESRIISTVDDHFGAMDRHLRLIDDCWKNLIIEARADLKL